MKEDKLGDLSMELSVKVLNLYKELKDKELKARKKLLFQITSKQKPRMQ